MIRMERLVPRSREMCTEGRCPTWCQAAHLTDSGAGDDVHWAQLRHVPAIERIAHGEHAQFEPVERALPIDVGVERMAGSECTYVAIVVDDARSRSLMISPSSARQLACALVTAADLALE